MNAVDPDRQELNRRVVSELEKAVGDLGIHDPQATLPNETEVQTLRRSRRRRVEDTTQMLSLVEVDGLLAWEPGFRTDSHLRHRRRRRGERPASGEVLKQFKFEKLQPNQVTGFLVDLDKKLTPHQGLRQWDGAKLVAVAKAPTAGPVLLFVHGTFSNNDNFFENLQSTREGAAFLSRAMKRYKSVLAFDHPTLSVSPIHNALDLAEHFRGSNAVVDVVAHSRGGLVTRWWFEALSPNPNLRGNAVLVGSPLAGTSLAAPPKLRSSLKLLTNFGRALTAVSSMASAAVPLLVGVTGLMKVVTSITSFAAHTPLVDTVVALVPGINGQSRVGNSQDLQRLRAAAANAKRSYHAIGSNFEPEQPGWRFWRYFTNPKKHGLDLVTDMVFQADNDLVVDTDSMNDLADGLSIPKSKTFIFPTRDDVHHLNYFEKRETLEHLSEWLLK